MSLLGLPVMPQNNKLFTIKLIKKRFATIMRGPKKFVAINQLEKGFCFGVI